MELKLASLSESLFHLKLGNVGLVGNNLFYLDDLLLSGGVDNHEIPVMLLEEWESFGADVAWHFILLEVVILDLDPNGDDILGGHVLLTLTGDLT